MQIQLEQEREEERRKRGEKKRNFNVGTKIGFIELIKGRYTDPQLN